MSRSYTKYGSFKNKASKFTKECKRRYNKKVRRYEGEIPNGKFYKKLNDQYDIRDYRGGGIYTYNEWMSDSYYHYEYYVSEMLFKNRDWEKAQAYNIEEALELIEVMKKDIEEYGDMASYWGKYTEYNLRCLQSTIKYMTKHKKRNRPSEPMSFEKYKEFRSAEWKRKLKAK